MPYRPTLARAVTLVTAAAFAQRSRWKLPLTSSVRELTPRATVDYATVRLSAKQLTRSLAGEWAFRLSPCPDDRPRAFAQRDLDALGWGTSEAPGNWEA